jgi:hypothetical protein
MTFAERDNVRAVRLVGNVKGEEGSKAPQVVV